MRVLHVIPGLGTGGAERSIADLAPRLASRGVEVAVVVLHARPAGVHREVAAAFPVRVLRSRAWSGRIRELRTHLRATAPDLLHTTLFDADVIGRLAAVGTGIPVVSSLVNTGYEPVRVASDPNVSPLRLWGARTLDSLTGRHLTVGFHAITEAARLSAIRHLKLRPDRITVIGRARDRARLGEPSRDRRLGVRRRLGLSERQPVVLALGRQEYQKGHRHLLEAAARLRSGHPDLVVLVAGREGNASAELAEAAERLGVGETVWLLGHRGDVGDLLSAADVFCHPSLYEGFGGALLEAMLMGVPIVAADLPAIREVVGEEAILVEPGSTASVAAGLEAMLRDPARRVELGDRGRRRAEAEFDLDVVAERMAAFYRDAVAVGPR